MNRWNLKHYFYDTRCQLSLLLVKINNNSNDTLHLLSDYYMPGTILSTSHVLLHPPAALPGSYHYYSHLKKLINFPQFIHRNLRHGKVI